MNIYIFDNFLWFRKFGNIFQMFSQKNSNLHSKRGWKKIQLFLVARVPSFFEFTLEKGKKEIQFFLVTRVPSFSPRKNTGPCSWQWFRVSDDRNLFGGKLQLVRYPLGFEKIKSNLLWDCETCTRIIPPKKIKFVAQFCTRGQKQKLEKKPPTAQKD